MSRLSRAYPDDPEMWASPPLHADVRVRCADPRCGRRVSPTSLCGCHCSEHDDALAHAPIDRTA
jgi:hypothetical protein